MLRRLRGLRETGRNGQRSGEKIERGDSISDIYVERACAPREKIFVDTVILLEAPLNECDRMASSFYKTINCTGGVACERGAT
jgi:hypothetical protein